MNESSGAAPVEPMSPPVPCKDRSAGLIIFGILTILLGVLAGLMALLILLQAAFARTTQGPPLTLPAMIPAIAMYGFLAVALVWLGTGSVMARRWARALLLIFSWSWLVIGVLSMAVMAFILPSILADVPASQPELPPAVKGVVMVVTFLVLGVIFVILPAVWTFFYNSRHVKATGQARDQATRWTDCCPLPVLAICLWSALSVPMMLIMPLVGHGVIPFFGTFLKGVPSVIFCFVTATVWGYAAWSLYKLEQRGWWLILIGFCVFTTSSVLTFARHDMMEMYRLMNYPEAQLEQMQKFSILTGNSMTWMMVLCMLPFLGYLLFIKKFLHREP